MVVIYDVARKYVHHRNYINKGLSEIYYFKTLVQAGLGLSVVLKLFIDSAPEVYAYVIGAFSVLLLFVCWFIGWFWDKIYGYEIDIEWNRLRDPFAKDVRKFIRMEKKCT